jgi:cysteine desulfurase
MPMIFPVYLDNSATTPCDPEVLQAMLPFFSERFGNAASHFHQYGWEAEEAVDQARKEVARLIGARPAEIVFTGSATESCNLAIKGAVESCPYQHPQIITVSTEHKAVLETVRHMEDHGCRVTVLPVDALGMPDLNELEQAIGPSTLLIAAMYANNETGVILPVKEIAGIARRHHVLFFSDATQAVGKIPVNVQEDGMDMMAFTAHKMYGPKGAAALYLGIRNRSLKITAQITGGSQERGYRGGTLNVPAIVGFGKAAVLAQLEKDENRSRLLEQRNKLEHCLLEIPGIHIHGDPLNRIPHISNISMEGIEGERFLLHVSNRLALSSGAACSTAKREPSHVLQAMGVTGSLLHSSIRLSQGRHTTSEEIRFALEEISNAIHHLRNDQAAAINSRLQPSSF